MKRTLFCLVCFLFSSVAFSQNSSSTSDSNFLDYLVKRKTITAQYRHQFFSVSDEKGNFKRFTRTPQFKINIPVDIFGGILVGTTKLKMENQDGKGGILKQPEFDITSPYLNFESEFFTAGTSISYVFPLEGKADLVTVNPSIGLAAPKIETGIGNISLTAGVDSSIYFKTYNRSIETDNVTPDQVGRHVDNTPFFLGTSSSGKTATFIKSQRPEFEVNFTLLKARLDTTCGLYTLAAVEYLNYYTPKFSINDENGKKIKSHAIERASKASWELGYKLTDNITIANTLSFGFNGLFADKLPAGWSIADTNTGAVKVSDVIGVQFTL